MKRNGNGFYFINGLLQSVGRTEVSFMPSGCVFAMRMDTNFIYCRNLIL